MQMINGVPATRDEMAAAVIVRALNDVWQVVTEDGVVAVRQSFAAACYRAQVEVDDLDALDVDTCGEANPNRRILVVNPDGDANEFVTLDDEVMSMAIRAKW